jgi:hypothetical protein
MAILIFATTFLEKICMARTTTLVDIEWSRLYFVRISLDLGQMFLMAMRVLYLNGLLLAISQELQTDGSCIRKQIRKEKAEDQQQRNKD